MPDKSPARIAAEKACRDFPNTPSRTLAKMLAEKRPKLFRTIEEARGLIRTVRGVHGEQNRTNTGDKSLYRSSKNAGEQLKLPESLAEEWKPYPLEGARVVLSLSDLHFPYHSNLAIDAAIDAGKKHSPDVVLINGDGLDFYGISRYERNPEHRSPVSEIKAFVEFLRYIRQQFPKARCVFKSGNHEERWDKYIWASAPVLWELEQIRLPGVLAYEYGKQTSGESFELSAYGWEHVGDQRPIMAGKLPICHGHELPKGLSSPVNPARGAFMRTLHTILIGHLHRCSTHPEPDMFGSETTCWSQGCLCGKNPSYARVNKWTWGFAVVEVAQGGDFNLHNYKITNNGTVRTV